MTLGIEGTRSLEDLYFLGEDANFFVAPFLLILLSIACMTVGYSLGLRAKPSLAPSIFRNDFSPTRLRFAVVGCALFGFAAFVAYAQATGGLSLSQLSAKRTLVGGLDASASYQSHGEYRFINVLGSIALWIQLAHYAMHGFRVTMLNRRGIWVLTLLINACLLPAFASTRAEIAFIVASAIAVYWCLGKGSLRWSTIAGWLVIALAAIASITTMRSSQRADLGGADVDLGALGDAFILTRTFADLPTTAHIIQAVPDRLPYENGATIGAWLLATIPRSIWPGKPVISAGPEIAAAIYGNDRTGVPPGLFGEAFWNFGVSGLLVLPLVCAFAMALLYNGLAPYAAIHPGAAVVLSAVVLRVGVDLTSNGIGYAGYQVLSMVVLLVPVLWFVQRRAPNDSPVDSAHRRARWSTRARRR